jgi:hypothetical protein
MGSRRWLVDKFFFISDKTFFETYWFMARASRSRAIDYLDVGLGRRNFDES